MIEIICPNIYSLVPWLNSNDPYHTRNSSVKKRMTAMFTNVQMDSFPFLISRRIKGIHNGYINQIQRLAVSYQKKIQLLLVIALSASQYKSVLSNVRSIVIKRWRPWDRSSVNSPPPPLMPHICVSVSHQHWFRWWRVAYSAPSQYLSQYRVIVNWTLRNKLRWNFHQIQIFFIHENVFENIVCKMAAFLSRGI